VSKRRASLEKDDAQADPTTLSGKADTAGVNERSSTPSRCAGVVAAACTQGKRTQHRERLLTRELDEKAVAVPRHPYLAVHALVSSVIRYVLYDIADLRNIFERRPAVFTA